MPRGTLIEPAALMRSIYESGEVEAADGTRLQAFPSVLPPQDADVLQRLLRERSLTRTLETGLGYGLSTLAICAVHEQRGEGEHVAIDPAQSRRWQSIGVLNLRRAGLERRLRLVEAPSHQALPQLRAEGLRLDFALIDGRHVFDTAMLDFFYADLMLDEGGIVVFHDVWLPAIAQVVGFVLANRAYELLESSSMLAVLEKTGPDERHWDFHRRFGAGWRRRSKGRRLGRRGR